MNGPPEAESPGQDAALTADSRALLSAAERRLAAGDPAAAERIATAVLKRDPQQRRALYLLSAALVKLDRAEEALRLLTNATTADGEVDAKHLNSLGGVLHALGRFEEAADLYRRSLSVDTQSAESHFRLGMALKASGDFPGAAAHLDESIHLRSRHAAQHKVRGDVFHEIGQFEEALSCYRDALAINPGFRAASMASSVTQRLTGTLREGWKNYFRALGDAPLPDPEKIAEPFLGAKVTVHCDEGLGDEIMYASCFPDLIRQAEQCEIACDHRLLSLFERSFNNVRFCGVTRRDFSLAAPVEPGHWQLLNRFLPMFFRRDFLSFPGGDAYLSVDRKQQQNWRSKLDELGTGLKVGISWRGGGTLQQRAARSIPLPRWARLLRLNGANIVDLQYGDTVVERHDVEASQDVKLHHWNEIDPLRELDSYAALIKSLDLVITVDNSTAHLAGALGVPVWNLVPFVPDWRWLLERDDTPWYPSMRLFRQERLGDWDLVIKKLESELRKLINS